MQFHNPFEYRRTSMKRVMTGAMLLTATILAISTQIAPAQNSAQSGDTRVKAALDKLGLKYEVDKDGDFKIVMKVEGGRTQLAWITSNTEKFGGMEIRQVFSPGYKSNGNLPSDIANQLLTDNARKKLGAWQTFKSDQTSLAVFSAKIAANGSAAELSDSLEAVLYSADEMEKTLTRKDDF
jgi:hypothetical protein